MYAGINTGVRRYHSENDINDSIMLSLSLFSSRSLVVLPRRGWRSSRNFHAIHMYRGMYVGTWPAICYMHTYTRAYQIYQIVFQPHILHFQSDLNSRWIRRTNILISNIISIYPINLSNTLNFYLRKISTCQNNKK